MRPLLKAPTQRVATLMAEIERAESGDEGRSREWMARALRAPRDPAWTADGFVTDRWMPVSPVSGRLDAFQWKVPLAELGDHREVIEGDELDLDKPPVLAAPEPPAVAVVEPTPTPPALSGAAPKPPKLEPRVEAIIPLLHVPDDPGPDPAPDLEPEPGPTGGSRNGLRLFK
jgi:HemY protein